MGKRSVFFFPAAVFFAVPAGDEREMRRGRNKELNKEISKEIRNSKTNNQEKGFQQKG